VHRDIVSFILILWILTGLQNPYGYGNNTVHKSNKNVCLNSQEVKSV